jgi:hypothetical protein
MKRIYGLLIVFEPVKSLQIIFSCILNMYNFEFMKDIQLSESYGTSSETINGLIKAGYTHDFNIKEDCLVCDETNTVLSPDDFTIDKVYRFEGATNPEDESIVYAISSTKSDIKGFLVNGYGTSADEASAKLVEKLRTHNS